MSGLPYFRLFSIIRTLNKVIGKVGCNKKRKPSNLSYADDTLTIAACEEDLKQLMVKLDDSKSDYG